MPGTILKVATLTQPVALTVTACKTVEGNYGPQYQLDGHTADHGDVTLYLNVSTAQRQLDRLGVDAQTIVGETIEVERVVKDGKTYTNLNRARAARAATPTNGKPATQATTAKQAYNAGPRIEGMDADDYAPTPLASVHHPAPPTVADPTTSRLDKLFALHDACLAHALSQTAQLERAKVGDSPEAISARAATLLIQATQRGMAA
jgi:hypothetical protein